jgi:hypothetical protein
MGIDENSKGWEMISASAGYTFKVIRIFRAG